MHDPPGLAFVGNKSWYTCNGFVQSYVSNDGTKESDTPVQFAGHLDPGVGVNVDSEHGALFGDDRGHRLRVPSRGLALHGLQGGRGREQDLRDEVPHAGRRRHSGLLDSARSGGPLLAVRVAIAEAKRGTRGLWRRTRRRFEVLGGATSDPAHPMQATTTIYSFQGVTNGGDLVLPSNWPVYETATILVIFDAASSSIAMRRLGATEFDFGANLSQATVDQWLANAGTTRPMP